MRAGQRVLVACSGGPDSMVMLHVLSVLSSRLGIEIMATSVDHQLRVQAAREVALVGKFAEDLGLGFVALKVQLSGQSSVQSAARDARYAALRSLMQAQRMDRLAVGHTRDDQAETVIERMTRGAGLSGLAAIAPARQDGVIRPLIDVRRAQVLHYAQRYGVPFVEDPSNADARYKRTRIRNTIMPLLEQEDPRVYEHLARLADDARSIAQWLTHDANEVLKRCQLSATELDARVLAREHQAVRRAALRLWLERLAQLKLSRVQIQAADRATCEGGEVWLKCGWRLREVDGVLKAILGDNVGTRPTRFNQHL